MQAETAYAVFEALPEKEKQRLLSMLAVSDVKIKKQPQKKPIITDAEAREYLINKFKKFSQRWKQKQ